MHGCKRVGVFADVRFKPGRAFGQNYDPGGIGHVSQELLLKITGRDHVTLGRKNIDPWRGQLGIKINLTTNELPNLNDRALASRFIKLYFGVSFLGREDTNLRAKLKAELPGIAARCILAYRRLCARGEFIQPQSGKALEREVLAASDPFAAMALDCFVPDGASTLKKSTAYFQFETWRLKNNRLDVNCKENKFGERLRRVAGFERIVDAPRPHGQPRAWFGMRIRKSEDIG